MKYILLLTLFLSFSLQANEKIYISFDDYCEVYELTLTSDNVATGWEKGCDSYKNTYVRGTYITLWPNVYDQNSLMMMLSINDDNSRIEYLDPLSQTASVYVHGGGTNQAKYTTSYNINRTLGQSTEMRK